MSDAAKRFIISRGLENNFTFTVKAEGSTLPITLDASDTFTAYLYDLSTQTEVDSWAMTKLNPFTDGKVELVISAIEANALTSARGAEEDRFYLKANYKLVLDCSTVQNGDFLAKVHQVYVD